MPRPMSSPYRCMEITLHNIQAFLEDLQQDSDAKECVELMQPHVCNPEITIHAAYFESRPVAVIGIYRGMYLAFVIVRQPHRRKGVGRCLMDKYATQVQSILIPHADRSDSLAHKFLRNVGWRDYKQMDLQTDSMIREDFKA
ncbi:putative GNAT N-acetyltransferase [Erwinia phage pEa_SNUABM_5]|uniref:Putative GNAT N-acetyltransferase n=1 Tax=Erwinia phage pEa_SNUABM_5 TaxID=2797313 RepID=A0A7T8IW61_9CAUD|nr:putative GNAT N-acetyltransferase [Erwinia phage pEa_SNUABM_5]QQO90437.1 putative GNAT N-acetyltransferase [Erwinia phage pEa_SNUABM_5]